MTDMATLHQQGRLEQRRVAARKGWERRRLHFAAEFWRRVDTSAGIGECWPWTGKRATGTGYGVLMRDGRSVGAHRVAHELTRGAIAAGLEVIHTCDNPACCNPDHVPVGTHAENARDMAAKGRSGPQMYPERYPTGDRHWLRRNPERASQICAGLRSRKAAL